MCLSRRLRSTSFYCFFLISLSFFRHSFLFSPSCLLSSVADFLSLLISLLQLLLPPCDTTACNGLKGLHSNNQETNCRALARYRARPVGRPRLAARDQHQHSYITVAFVTATCLCFRLVFAIPLHRSLSSLVQTQKHRRRVYRRGTSRRLHSRLH